MGLKKKVALVTFKGQDIFIANVVELDPNEVIQRKVKCDAALENIIVNQQKEIDALKHNIAKLFEEIKYLKGEK